MSTLPVCMYHNLRRNTHRRLWEMLQDQFHAVKCISSWVLDLCFSFFFPLLFHFVLCVSLFIYCRFDTLNDGFGLKSYKLQIVRKISIGIILSTTSQKSVEIKTAYTYNNELGNGFSSLPKYNAGCAFALILFLPIFLFSLRRLLFSILVRNIYIFLLLLLLLLLLFFRIAKHIVSLQIPW